MRADPLTTPEISLLTAAVAVQNYITAILIFLMIEMLMTWGFYGTFPGFFSLFTDR